MSIPPPLPPNVDPFTIYESLAVIGRGKHSEVHQCRHRSSGWIVALKCVHIFDMDSSGRNECINEANMLQSLPKHPHIIQYYTSTIHDNVLYLVLEYADRGDIGKVLEQRQGKRMEEREVWHYFAQICEALYVMHSCRVMHRDIKPSNIFLTSSLHTIKLGDLGLGRYMSSKTMEAYSMVGTPFYMSPETINSNGYDFKSDIWSLGCLLYELCCLKSPFHSSTLNYYVLGNKIKNAIYDPLPNEFSLTLHSLVSWMLQPNPDARPSIGAVLQVARAACAQINANLQVDVPVQQLRQQADMQQNNAQADQKRDDMKD